MKIVAFAGSPSQNSINKKFAAYAAACFAGYEVVVLDLNDFPMPLFSVDVEVREGHPPIAKEFLAKLSDADFLIVSLAENNGSYSAVFKNLLDWCSRITNDVFAHKPMFLLSTSPGKMGGRFVMQAALSRFPIHSAKIFASFSLPEFGKNFSSEKGITDAVLAKEFADKVAQVRTQLQTTTQ